MFLLDLIMKLNFTFVVVLLVLLLQYKLRADESEENCFIDTPSIYEIYVSNSSCVAAGSLWSVDIYWHRTMEWCGNWGHYDVRCGNYTSAVNCSHDSKELFLCEDLPGVPNEWPSVP